MPACLAGAAAWAAHSGPLVVYIPTGLPGLHMQVNGQPQGFYPDVFEQLAQRSGIELELRTEEWPGPIEAVREGRGQVIGPIMGQPSAFTDLVHSEPLMRVEWARYVRLGDARSSRGVGYAGIRFAALSGVSTRWLTRDHPKAVQVEVETIEEGLQAVIDGRADALLALKLPARRVLSQQQGSVRIEEVGTELTSPMTVAFAPVAAHLVPTFNEAIRNMLAAGEIERLHERWLPPSPDTAAEVTQRRLTWALLAVVAALLLLAGFLWVSNERLRMARRQADGARRAKSDFLAVMSHEIRTPINGLVNLIDLLQRSGTTPEQAGLLRQAELANRSLLGLINQVLDFSKIEAARIALELRPLVLDALMVRVEAVLRAQTRAPGVDLIFEPPPADMPAVMADEERLVQVLINLGGNALKFTQQGQVRVSVKPQQPLRDEQGRLLLRFEVSDTGPGIPPEQVEHLFRPFVQLNSGLGRPHTGTGLGLSTCREIASLMGSSIRVRSTPHVLTRFWFDLALEPAERPVAADAGADESGDVVLTEPVVAFEAGLALECCVMVVDDNRLNLLVTRKILEQAGATVLQAESAEAALGLLEADGASLPRLILMDLQMPGVDGIEAVRKLRLRLAGRMPPVLAVSGAVTEEAQAAARAVGMAGFVPKPFDRLTLLKAVAPFCG